MAECSPTAADAGRTLGGRLSDAAFHVGLPSERGVSCTQDGFTRISRDGPPTPDDTPHPPGGREADRAEVVYVSGLLNNLL